MVDTISFANGRSMYFTSAILDHKKFHPLADIIVLDDGSLPYFNDYGKEKFVIMDEYVQSIIIPLRKLRAQKGKWGAAELISNTAQLCVRSVEKALNYNIDYELEYQQGFFEQIMIWQRDFSIFSFTNSLQKQVEITAVFSGNTLVI